jgi:hypothetical protein
MMSMTTRKFQAMCVVAMGLSGCAMLTDQPAPQAASAPKFLPKPALFPMGPCAGGEPQAVRVVRIVIPRGFDPANMTRNVRFKVVGPHDDPDADDVSEDGKPNDIGDAGSPLDVNLKSIGPVNGAFAQIRVVLKDPDYSFFEGDGVPGVQLASTANPLRLCGARHGKHGALPVSVFLAPMGGTGLQPICGEFMIALAPKNHPNTVVFIDPCIQNDG